MSSSSEQNAEHEDASHMDEISRYQDAAARYFVSGPHGRPAPPTHPRRTLPPPPSYAQRLGADHSRSYNSSVGRTTFRPRPNAERYRRARTAQERSINAPRDPQRAVSQLDEENRNLRALLDEPIPNISSPSYTSIPAANESASEAEPGRRSSKRRKLEMDNKPPDFKAFSYGYHGQVVPGQLNMEIASCDGGSFESDSNMHAAENVLKDDRSVYCTKANRCNLVLKHQGERPFCLDELVIKAPPRGYTAPVQEGMVFISMSEDDLLARTARYQIQYSPKKPRRRSYEDPESESPNVVSIRHHGDGSVSTSHFARRLRHPHGEDDEDDRQAQIPSDFAVLNSSNFTVTTECSDDEEEDDEDFDFSFPGPRRTYNHAEPFTFDDTDGEDGETPWYLRASERIRPQQPQQESNRRDTPSNITLADAIDSAQVATQEALKAVSGEYLAAHARFFIEKNKSKCTIKFDPPISGRFILLKMWSPRRETNKNIDIQSVVCRGFAGPRLFPAQKFC